MAYKVFQNGFPIPASELNNYLMNQSVIVFASSAARSSTLPTPTEGMVTYLKDTNALQVYTGAAWVNVNDNSNAILKSLVTTAGDLIVGTGNATVARLGVGGNGAVLLSNGTTATWLALGANNTVLTSNGTTATWSTPASAGEVLISSTTASGSTISLTSIPNTYNHLKINAYNLNFNADGTPTINANSIGARSLMSGSDAKHDVSDGPMSFNIEFPFYKSSALGKFGRTQSFYESDSTTNTLSQFTNLGWETTSAIDTITIALTGGATSFTQGTIELWGVR